MYRVLIVDDHALVRKGIQQVIAEEPSNWETGEAANAAEAWQLINDETWDAIVLDFSLPDKNGLELLREIKYAYPNLPCLMLSMHSTDQMALHALQAGAAGYLTKETAPDELLTALKQVIAGELYTPPALAGKLASLPLERARPVALSARETQIARQLAMGKTVSETAAALQLSVKTVSTYRTRLLAKMQLRNNAELIHYAAYHGIIELLAT